MKRIDIISRIGDKYHVGNTENGEFTFRFFRYSERKVYFTVNGGGNYYMISDRVEKIWTDANKIIAGEDVSATDKN